MWCTGNIFFPQSCQYIEFSDYVILSIPFFLVYQYRVTHISAEWFRYLIWKKVLCPIIIHVDIHYMNKSTFALKRHKLLKWSSAALKFAAISVLCYFKYIYTIAIHLKQNVTDVLKHNYNRLYENSENNYTIEGSLLLYMINVNFISLIY